MSRLLKNNDVKLYWDRFREIFSPEKEKLWDCLMIGLPKYHSILQGKLLNIFLGIVMLDNNFIIFISIAIFKNNEI